MKLAPKWAVCLLACAGGWVPAPGCHEFHACGSRRCEPAGGNVSTMEPTLGGAGGRDGHTAEGGNADAAGGAAGAGGGHAGVSATSAGASSEAGGPGSAGAPLGDAGGEGGAAAAACAAPFADCDESTFNGCESNLLVEIRNCGACRAYCAGACIAGQCSPFETLSEDVGPPTWGGIVLTSGEVYAISHVPNSVIRWSPRQGAQTLVTDGRAFSQILGGVDRLYLFGGNSDELFSIPRFLGVVSSEGIAVKAAVMVDQTLFAVDDANVPFWRSELDHTTGARPLPAPLPRDALVWLVADANELVLVAAATSADGAVTYSVHYIWAPDDPQHPWQQVASGAGRPAQVRLGEAGIYIDVIVPQNETPTDYWHVVHELREIHLDGTTRVVSSLTGLLDFELVRRRLYLSVEFPNYASALRVVPLDDPTRPLEVQTSSSMRSLTYSDGFFYFGETSRVRLARLPAWLE